MVIDTLRGSPTLSVFGENGLRDLWRYAVAWKNTDRGRWRRLLHPSGAAGRPLPIRLDRATVQPASRATPRSLRLPCIWRTNSRMSIIPVLLPPMIPPAVKVECSRKDTRRSPHEPHAGPPWPNRGGTRVNINGWPAQRGGPGRRRAARGPLAAQGSKGGRRELRHARPYQSQ
jgi:hypothetical protein